MPKLHTIVAVTKDKKSRWQRQITDTYQSLANKDGLSGLTKTFRPIAEDQVATTPEVKLVTTTVPHLIATLEAAMISAFDVVLTQDSGNMSASADVYVDGKIFLSKVPATHLLFLEKQLFDLGTFINSLPVLDPSESWVKDTTTGQYKSGTKLTNSERNVPKVIVKSEATDKHPAQAEIRDLPQIVARIETTKMSGAISLSEKTVLIARQRTLLDAVRAARQEANTVEVENREEGKKIFDFLFGTILS